MHVHLKNTKCHIDSLEIKKKKKLPSIKYSYYNCQNLLTWMARYYNGGLSTQLC